MSRYALVDRLTKSNSLADLAAHESLGAALKCGIEDAIVTRLTVGKLAPDPQDSASLRIVGLTLAPGFAGLILMFATTLAPSAGTSNDGAAP
jgi:hypothetical protein